MEASRFRCVGSRHRRWRHGRKLDPFAALCFCFFVSTCSYSCDVSHRQDQSPVSWDRSSKPTTRTSCRNHWSVRGSWDSSAPYDCCGESRYPFPSPLSSVFRDSPLCLVRCPPVAIIENVRSSNRRDPGIPNKPNAVLIYVSLHRQRGLAYPSVCLLSYLSTGAPGRGWGKTEVSVVVLSK